MEGWEGSAGVGAGAKCAFCRRIMGLAVVVASGSYVQNMSITAEITTVWIPNIM